MKKIIITTKSGMFIVPADITPSEVGLIEQQHPPRRPGKKKKEQYDDHN